ncbi:hypothetical protein hmeg3_13010 [Herbaspirillum sp. meg3]|uniref:hypothetical protein n=1 Tax=Herbaspirillum sp. meg3 TaxID=2025949 RepID=UPI000B97E3A2|nr:hypothetical protein [Herbaspirillum sp. meg3]ASU39113.1 hypothetical protein hmeg3_13010 [Herbaspirillum sp. meg3]
MNRRLALVTMAAAILIHAPVFSAPPKRLELFGMQLKGATRDQLRQTFKQNGVNPVREDDRYWVDNYNANGVLDGATEFSAGYVSATSKFAFAGYTFPSRMDTQQVGKIIDMVAAKYGRPTSRKGNYGLGEVAAIWSIGQGMELRVTRGWPDTTTYLLYVDLNANKAMEAEIAANRKTQQAEKAKAQSKAF